MEGAPEKDAPSKSAPRSRMSKNWSKLKGAVVKESNVWKLNVDWGTGSGTAKLGFTVAAKNTPRLTYEIEAPVRIVEVSAAVQEEERINAVLNGLEWLERKTKADLTKKSRDEVSHELEERRAKMLQTRWKRLKMAQTDTMKYYRCGYLYIYTI